MAKELDPQTTAVLSFINILTGKMDKRDKEGKRVTIADAISAINESGVKLKSMSFSGTEKKKVKVKAKA